MKKELFMLAEAKFGNHNLNVFEQTFERKLQVKGWSVREEGQFLVVRKNQDFEITRGGMYDKLWSRDEMHGLQFVHLVQPDDKNSIRVLHSFQWLLFALNREKVTYLSYANRMHGMGLTPIHEDVWDKMREAGVSKELLLATVHANAIKPSNKMPVALMGTLEMFGKAWELEGEKLSKAWLKHVKWGMPANTPSTSRFIHGIKFKVALVPEDQMVLKDCYKSCNPRYHEGVFIIPQSVKLVAAMYQRPQDAGNERTFKLLSECQLRVRDKLNGSLTVAKGLIIVVSQAEFEELINKFDLPEDCNMITGDDNIKMGSKAPVQEWDSSQSDLINIAATHNSTGRFGRQGLLLHQRASYQLFTHWNWMMFRNLDGTRVKRRPIEVFIEAVRGDFAAWCNILLKKEQATWEDFTTTTTRALFFPIKDDSCPSGYRVSLYRTSYNTLANRLMTFLNQDVLRVKMPTRSMYLTSNPELDDLIISHHKATGEGINPIIPQKVSRVYRAVKKFCMDPEYKWAIETHPIVGAGQVQEVHFVARVNGELVLWTRDMGFDAILWSNHLEVNCKYHKQAVKDNDGDMAVLAWYKGDAAFPLCGIPKMPEAEEVPEEYPTSDVEVCKIWMDMIPRLEGTIGRLDNISTADAVNRIVKGEFMSPSTSILAGWQKEAIIKATTRVGSTKLGTVIDQEEFLERFISEYCLDGIRPKKSPLWKMCSNSQGVYSDEADGWIGGASFVNGFLNNCRHAMKELDIINGRGDCFMYQDIVKYVASIPKINIKGEMKDLSFRMVPEDANQMLLFCNRAVNGMRKFFSDEASSWAEERASKWCDRYDTRSVDVLDRWREKQITSAEKSKLFGEIGTEINAKIIEKFDEAFPHGEASSSIERERMLRYVAALCGIEGFRNNRPGSAFWFFPLSVKIWLAKKWWKDNPILDMAAEAFVKFQVSPKGEWVTDEE